MLKKLNIGKLFYVLFLGMAIGIFAMGIINRVQIRNIEGYEVIYNVRIENDYINVRNQPTTSANVSFQVVKGEVYEVVEVFEDDSKYVWYKIIYTDRATGWIASDRDSEWASVVE